MKWLGSSIASAWLRDGATVVRLDTDPAVEDFCIPVYSPFLLKPAMDEGEDAEMTRLARRIKRAESGTAHGKP